MGKQVQRYNVLCVTKGSRDGRAPWCGYKIPGDGEIAEVVSSHKEEYGVRMTYTTVRFQGREHELLRVVTGLGGAATVLVVALEDPPYDSLELQTDTPIPGVSMDKEVLKKMATDEMSFHGNRWGLI